MVVVPRKDGIKVCLCVDLTGLNECVCHKKYMLLSVEQSYRMLEGLILQTRCRHGDQANSIYQGVS